MGATMYHATQDGEAVVRTRRRAAKAGAANAMRYQAPLAMYPL